MRKKRDLIALIWFYFYVKGQLVQQLGSDTRGFVYITFDVVVTTTTILLLLLLLYVC